MKILLTAAIVSTSMIVSIAQAASCEWILRIKNEQTMELRYYEINVNGEPTMVDLKTHGYAGLCSGIVETRKPIDPQMAVITDTVQNAILFCGISPEGNDITPVSVQGFMYEGLSGNDIKRHAKMTLNTQFIEDADGVGSVPLYTATLKCE